MEPNLQNPTLPARKKRWPKWTGPFLKALEINGVITHAAIIAHVDRSTVYDLRKADPTFAAAWNEAIETSTDTLELEAIRRARDGVVVQVIFQGKACTVWVNANGEITSENAPGAKEIPLTIREYSDTLLARLLAGRRKELYGTTRQEVSGPGGSAIPVQIYIPENDREPEED